jgi:hypothetical protein
MSNNYLSIDHAKEIYEYLCDESKNPTLEDFIEEYAIEETDMILVNMSFEFRRGGEWKMTDVVDKDFWRDCIRNDLVLNLGEACGKHSDVTLKLSDIAYEIIRDPYLIHHALETNTNGFLEQEMEEHGECENRTIYGHPS